MNLNPLILPAVRALQAYQRVTPVSRGRYRVAACIAALVRHVPPHSVLQVHTPDGCVFNVNPDERQHAPLLLYGSYDPTETALLKTIVRPGDVVFDLGANFGYYTVLLARFTGARGQVHSFEPIPLSFRELTANCAANRVRNAVLNNCALHAEERRLPLHIFAAHSSGDASASTYGLADYTTYDCLAVTLDGYIAAHHLSPIALLKCDVEGSEMAVLTGARMLLSAPQPPMWLLELNRATSRACGYAPSDLLDLLQDAAGYAFYHIDGPSPVRLRKLNSTTDHGDLENVLCAIPDAHMDRLRTLLGRKA